MSDILHGFTPQPPPPLTSHLRHHLAASFRCERDRAERARAPLETLPKRTPTQAQRWRHLTDIIARCEADLAELGVQH